MKTYLRPAFVVSAILLLSVACRLFDGPDKPNPPSQTFEEKRFTLRVEYLRVDVKRSDLMERGASTTITDRNAGTRLVSDQMVKKDDCHYEKQFLSILETESYGNCYYIHALDQSRWDGVDNSSAIVGDIFTLNTLKEDGTVISTLKLTNILQNDLPTNPSKGPQARMAKFCIQRDGTLTNGD